MKQWKVFWTYGMRGIDGKYVKMLAGSFLEDIPLSVKRPIHAQLN
jgi:hypothetical protein